MPWVAAFVAVVGTIASQEQQSKARAEQKEANKQQLNLAKARERRNRMKTLREERVKRARLVAATSASGAGGSSAERSALSSLATQRGTELGFQQQQLRTQGLVTAASQRASDAQGRAGFYGTIANYALQFEQTYG